MAFTVTARHSGNSSTTSAQTLATGSTTPTASSLLLVASGAQNDNHTGTRAITYSGGSLSYSNVVTSAEFAFDGTASFSIANGMHQATVGGSPSAFAITADHYSTTNLGYYAIVGCDITGHNAGAPVVQSKATGASTALGDSVSGSVTFDSALTTGNLVVASFAASADAGGGFATPTVGGQSMTALFNQNASYTQAGLWYRVLTGAESSGVVTCSDMGQSVGNWAGTVVEVAAGSAAAPGRPVGRRRQPHQWGLLVR